MSYRQPIELVASEAPVRHEPIHDRNESGIVRGPYQVCHLVDYDVFETLLGFLGQFCIQANRASPVVAASPFRLHLLDIEARYLNTHHRRPPSNHWRNRRLHLVPIPLGDNLLHLLLISAHRETQQ